MKELTNPKSSDYNFTVQSPWTEWLYKIKTLSQYDWMKGEQDKKTEWQNGPSLIRELVAAIFGT